MKSRHKNQKGFTLIELLVALPLVAIVTFAASTVAIQTMQSSRTTNHMVALGQVQNAGNWISQDAIQAQQVTVLTSPGFLSLEWTNWDNSDTYKVDYSLIASGDLNYLERKEIVNGDTSNPIIMIVSRYIDDSTECAWDSIQDTLTVEVTARVGEQLETRLYEIKPRPLI